MKKFNSTKFREELVPLIQDVRRLMKLDANTDVIRSFFKKIEYVYDEELAEGKPNIFDRLWFHAWKSAEEYHRERLKSGLSTEQDAINRNCRLS